MKKFQASVSLIIIVSLLGLSSCVTQNHRVEWRTPEIETPISASPYYLTPQNELVGPEEYRIVDHFSFTREAVGKVEGTTESEISIDEDLKKVIGSVEARAVVNLQVYAQGHDPGNLFPTVFTRIFGSMMLIFGGPFLLIDGLQEVGLYLAAPGAVSLGISYILPANSESRWTIGFEGDLVEPLTSD
jgi:hypothetical protein